MHLNTTPVNVTIYTVSKKMLQL